MRLRLDGAALVAAACFSGVLAMTSVAHFSVLTVRDVRLLSLHFVTSCAGASHARVVDL